MRVTVLFVAAACALWHTDSSAQTGDATIDSLLAGFVHRGGNNTAPSSIQPGNYSIFNACNSSVAPSWDQRCPSDLTYTPLAGAGGGGYQAFGVGLTNYPQQQYWEPYCYFWWWFDHDGQYHFEYRCDWYLVSIPAYSYGIAVARITFSSLAVTTAMGVSQPLSTLALKSAFNHTGVPQVYCEPIMGLALEDMHCTRQNAYVVPNGSDGEVWPRQGYEDKIKVSNPSCSVLHVRWDNLADQQAGCFSGFNQSWWSDLPGAYTDSNIGDIGELFGENPFIAAVGSATPSAIQEGYTYTWRRNFAAYGNQSIGGTETRHLAAVTMYANTYPCDGSSPALCQFNVDQTNIAPPATVQ